MPLRVLFAIGSMDVGGAERQVVRYLKHLDRSRFAPSLYLTVRRGPLLGEIPSDVPILSFEERSPPVWINWPGRIHQRQVSDLARALDECRTDLLVTRAFQQTLVAGSAVRRRPTPLVAVEASDPRRDFRRQVRRFSSIKRSLVAQAYGSATAVVALSDGAAQGLCEFYGIPRERVTVLPNFVDLEELDKRAAEPGPKFDPREFNVVCVGRLSTEKGQDVLLDAAGRLLESLRIPNLHLYLVGEGPARGHLERLASRPPIAGAVSFVGYQPNPATFVRQADVFCLPSRQEGMPGALLEAMACGVPVIAADCESGPREVLDGGRYGTLVPVDDPAALAEAIETISWQSPEARQKAIEARRRVEQTYSAPVVMARIEQLLETAAGR